MDRHTFTAEIWASESVGTWAFVTLSPEVDEEIRLGSGPPTAFGSVRVEASVGATTWRTSVFPDKVRGFVLPVKTAVRRAEGLEVGDDVTVSLVVLAR